MECRLCGSSRTVNRGDIGIRPVMVTSDARFHRGRTEIHRCEDCGHWQKFPNAGEVADTRDLYRTYVPHHLSKGKEQVLFSQNGVSRPRTSIALERCLPHLPRRGVLLDFGAGNGAVLKSAGAILDGWEFHAFDVDDCHRDEILALEGVSKFYCRDLHLLAGNDYDLIVTWHVLEHVESPGVTLETLAGLLKPGGKLLFQVPDAVRNPFDLAVFDHVSHFTHAGLKQCLEQRGFSVVLDGYDWTHNCLTFLVQHASRRDVRVAGVSADLFSWVRTTVVEFEGATRAGPYAVFGTGMASLWTYAQMERKPVAFVDEDLDRVGGEIEGVRIVAPGDPVLSGHPIVMPFVPSMAERLATKLRERYGLAGPFVAPSTTVPAASSP